MKNRSECFNITYRFREGYSQLAGEFDGSYLLYNLYIYIYKINYIILYMIYKLKQ